jgi:hypothetical protein
MRTNFKIIKLSLVIGVLFLSNICSAQKKIKLNKNIKIDTLRLWVNFPTNFNLEKKASYTNRLNTAVEKYNLKNSFHTVIDSSNKKNLVLLNMDSIQYVNKRDNLKSSGANLLLLGSQIVMVSTVGPPLPFLTIFFPKTKCNIHLNIDKQLIEPYTFSQSKIKWNGYLKSKERQDTEFEHRFQIYIERMLKRINKQNIKNNKQKG